MGRLAATALLGVAAGVFGGMFGVGGGLVMVPGMVLLMSMSQHRAHATSVAAIAAAAAAGVIPSAIDGRVHWDVAGLILIGGLVGAAAGARLIARVPERWLAAAFVAIVVVAAVRMALAGDAGPDAESVTTGAMSWPGAAGFVLIGLVAGALAAMLGVGGGIVYVPALVTLFEFAQHDAQATSLAVIAPTTALAAWVHGKEGRVDWPRAAALGLGGLAGGALGAWSALAVEGLVLRRLFAGVLTLVALRMIRRSFGGARAAGSEAGSSRS